MRQLIFLQLFAVCFSSFLFAQTTGPDSQAMNQKVAELYRQGKFDEAIPISEKVVAIEKKIAKNSETHAIALMNLGMLHKERLKTLQKLPEPAKPEILNGLSERIGDDARKAEKSLRDSLEIYVSLGNGEGLSAALIKNELAWVLNNHIPFPTPGGPGARIDEAERLYTESLAAQEKLTGAESDATLRSVLGFGDFYMRWVNFEKALPFYERYLGAVEKKLGASSKALVPALRGLLEVFVIADRNKDAEELAQRISVIKGEPEPLPITSPRLALRGRKIARVRISNFPSPDLFDHPNFLLSYPYGIGQVPITIRPKVKRVVVNILVDETGNVIEAKVADKSVNEASEIEKAALSSKFRPFIYKGESRKMRGSLVYPYFKN